MNFETLILEHESTVSVITLNRPDKLNALNAQLLDDLCDAIIHLQRETDTRSLIITGSGTKAFAAGADINELHQCDVESGRRFAARGQEVFMMIENFPVPVIAAVNGFALGGGCELALACHIRYASENAKFGQPEVKLGIIPGYGGTQRLTRVCGVGIATELICSGEMLNAEQALRAGLVNRVVTQDELLNVARKTAQQISMVAPLAVRSSMKCIRTTVDTGSSDGMSFEATEFAELCGTKDFKEGTRAFIEKRPAIFTGL